MSTPSRRARAANRIISLDEPAALDAARVGAKAVGLALAAKRGCPVLPGFVVPVAEFAELLERSEEVAADRGVHAAQLEVSLTPLDPQLLDEVKALAAPLGMAFVCRSSSAVEGDATWSGAFSSFIGVSLEELEIAISGCVASVFSPEIVGRLEGRSERLVDVAPSVLVQRLLEPAFGGTARGGAGEPIEIVAVKGSPGPLLAGWARGSRASLEESGEILGPAVGLLGRELIERLGTVITAVGSGPNTLIEWAAVDGSVVLLQVGQVAAKSRQPTRRRRSRAPLAPDTIPIAVRAARILSESAGPLGDRLVLPWRLAPGDPSEAPMRRFEALGLRHRLQRAIGLSVELNSHVLGTGSGDASELLEALASRTTEVDLRRLLSLRPAPPNLAGELLALISSISRTLHSRGLLAPSTPLLAIEPSVLEGALEAEVFDALVPTGSPLRRWQRLLQVAIICAGEALSAEEASSGVVAGPARYIPPHSDGSELLFGEVAVVDQPLVRFAPLLWRAAGMIVLGGNQSAHLIEVARSRRVPAVLSPDLGDDQRHSLDGGLVFVDGDNGDLVVIPRGLSAGRNG